MSIACLRPVGTRVLSRTRLLVLGLLILWTIRLRGDDSVWTDNRRDGTTCPLVACAFVVVFIELVLGKIVFVVARFAPEDAACALEKTGHD